MFLSSPKRSTRSPGNVSGASARGTATALVDRRHFKTHYVYRLLGAPLRSVDGKGMTEAFLICAVGTILGMRTYLVITGYSQFGGGGLHIAHLLWGGALLAVAVLLTVCLITRASRWVAAVLGGVGFGLFIDEIGKFVTSDNDYFFQPTIALIYIALVLIWLAMRAVTRKGLTHAEALANALDLLKEAASRDLNAGERSRALALLDRSDPDDPLVGRVRGLLRQMTPVAAPPSLATTRLMRRVRNWYWQRATKRWFTVLLTAIFVALTLATFGHVAHLGRGIADAINAPDRTFSSLNAAVNGGENIGFSGWAALGSSSIVAVLYSVGVYRLIRSSRLAAYRWFDWGLLVSILIVQVFEFADQQLGAIGTLIFNLVLLMTLRAMTAEERRREHAGGVTTARPLVTARPEPAPAGLRVDG
jgi:hypothetical protein